MRVKKIISVLLAAVLSLQVSAFVNAQKNEKTEIIESNAYGLLTALGLMDKGEEVSDEEIVNRAELAKAVYKLSGFDNAYYMPIFSDVNADSENAAYITALADMGIVAKADNYYPDSAATYEQAVKMIIGVLGYNRIIPDMKWPDDYLSKASSIGLLADIGAKKGDILTKRMLISLIYNSLGCQIIVPDMNGDYIFDSEKTILSENFDVLKKRGVVNANELTYLSINANADVDTVIVGDDYYIDKTDNLSSLLGYEVYVYYTEGDDGDEAIYAVKTSKNNVISIRERDLDKEAITDLSKIVYFENGMQKNARLSGKMDVIYNGKAFPSFTLDTLKIDTGNLELIDNNGDNVIDVVMVWEFENYVFESNDKTNEIIIDKFGKYFDYSDIEVFDIYSMYDQKIDISSIIQWNVISIYRSLDGEYAKAVVYDDPVIGTISGLYTDNGKTYIVVDDEHYAISDGYMEAVENGRTNAVEIVLNQEGIYYLDADERVAGAVIEQDFSFRYAYLVRGVYEEEEECMILKLLYDEAKGVQSVKTAQYVKLDGKKQTSKTAFDILCNGSEVPEQQLIKFMLNGDANIVYIDTVTQGTSETKENLTCNAFMEDLYWSVRTGRLGKDETISFLLDTQNTKVFCVPEEDIYNSDRFSMRLLGINNNEPLKISAYDSDEMGVAKVIVVYTNRQQQNAINIGNTGGCIISSIQYELNSDDEPVYVVDGYKLYGGDVHYVSDGEIDLSYLKVGDFVDFSLDYNNEISYVHMIFDSSNKNSDIAYKVYNEGSDGTSAYITNHGQYISLSVIADKIGKYIKLPLVGENLRTLNVSDIGLGNSQIYSLADATIYLCKNNKMTKITSAELESYKYGMNRDARCLFLTTYSQLRSIVVYDN